MYYFRDCYFDQQVAFGVARASYALPGTRRSPRRASPHGAHGSVLGFLIPFVYMGLAFGLGTMVLEVVGLEHLAQPPSLEALARGLAPHVEFVRLLAEDASILVVDAAARIPAMVGF